MDILNDDIYDKDNLKSEDKRFIEQLDTLKEQLLGFDTVDEYLENIKAGKKAKEIISEQLIDFIQYLSEQWDIKKIDCLIDTIESYSEEELKNIISNKPEKHGSWIINDKGQHCSECDFIVAYSDKEDETNIYLYPYCPNCGCRMDKEC